MIINRGFEEQEFIARTQKAQEMMLANNIDAILITTEAIFRYYTGFNSQFWTSPTRPWFLVIPAEDKPIAVIPSIGVQGLKKTWIDDIYSWDSPNPEDDGISLLADILSKKCNKYKKIAAPLGQESKVGMPYLDFVKLQKLLVGIDFVDVAVEIHKLRSIKSAREIEKIQAACDITHMGFENLPNHITIGQTERDICRQMTIDLFNNGADKVPYLIIGTGQNGYDTIIMGPTDRKIINGDILVIDTGVNYDGYYADFCRNYGIGQIDDATKRANEVVYNALEAGFKILRPGVTTTDIYTAMWDVLKAGGAKGNNIGRIGHGLGSELTEWPSNTSSDNNILKENMVITLEPSMEYGDGKEMVHEECVLITADGATWLSKRAEKDIIVIG